MKTPSLFAVEFATCRTAARVSPFYLRLQISRKISLSYCLKMRAFDASASLFGRLVASLELNFVRDGTGRFVPVEAH